MGSDGNQGLVFMILGFVVLALVLFLSRFLRRRGASDPHPGTFGVDTKAELEQLVAEIRDAAREEIARLDTKMRMLNQLLADCDRKARELEALLGRAAAKPAPPPQEGKEPPSGGAGNPLHEKVFALQDAGKDLGEICDATGLEKGEAELILGLRRMPPLK